MIACLNGALLFADPAELTCIVECGGVGYELSVTANTFSKLPPADEDGSSAVRLFTHMQILSQTSSAEVTLFGFADRGELDFFRLLITVQGVGPKAAMSLLSLYDPESLAILIANEDTRSIAKATNIGAKTAARIVLELAEKTAKLFPTLASGGVAEKRPIRAGKPKNSPAIADARDALLVLGYSQSAINNALAECDPTLGTDALIRAALTVLSAK
jgi:Holliday junction DNA helicase RuvA